ncbi:MAG: hypothetical protein PHP54_00245 [Clostridia bacterium]|nr:hypothetical protein [Clostridia bacterium]
MDNNNNIQDQNENQGNSQEIFNLIQSIQSKLDTNDNKNEVKQIEFEDTIEKTKEKNIDNNTNNKFNLSGIGSLLQNVDLGSILGLLGNSNNSNNKTKENNSGLNFDSIDPNTIMKIQRVMSSMGKDDPQKNLLLSLKPFLRKSRQDKIGEYMSMLTIAKAFESFTSKGSDDNV